MDISSFQSVCQQYIHISVSVIVISHEFKMWTPLDIDSVSEWTYAQDPEHTAV